MLRDDEIRSRNIKISMSDPTLRGRGNTGGGDVSPPVVDPSPVPSNESCANAPFPHDISNTRPGYYANDMFRSTRHQQTLDTVNTDELFDRTQNRGISSARSNETTQTIPGIDKTFKKRIMFIVLLLSTVMSSIGAWIKYNS